MEVPVEKQKQFICIHHPALIKNVDKMLETIGGEQNIKKTLSDPTRRLEMKLRPEDPYCKPACGDRQNVTNLLLKVRRRKRKKDPGSCTSQSHSDPSPGTSTDIDGQQSQDTNSEYEFKAEVLGTIDTEFNFQTMADFQYLPMEKQEDGTHKSLIDELCIKGLVKRSWLDKPVKLFLPPPIFSRIDNPIDYAFRDAPKAKRESLHGQVDGDSSNLIGVSRRRRPHYTMFANFEDKEMPSKPFPQAVDKIKAKIKDENKLAFLKELFEKRPIWSKNALKCHIDLSPEHFKICLPAIAYYYITGPWRSLWVRLGYDPRKDPSAKMYQLLDFRVRQKSAADQLKINAKRSTYSYNLPNQVNKTSSQVALIQQDTLHKDYSSKAMDQSHRDLKESIFKFRPGIIPAYRQMFYQFCDIEEPDIIKLVRKNDGKEEECDERQGWCMEDVQEKCRAILSKHLRSVINKGRPSEIYTSAHKIDHTKSHPKKIIEDEDEENDEGNEEEEEDMETEEAGAEEGEDNEMETEMLEYMEPEIEAEGQ